MAHRDRLQALEIARDEIAERLEGVVENLRGDLMRRGGKVAR
jgi:hypothetical protein